MANIDPYIEQIASARYGKDVRQSIIDALVAMNSEISTSGVQSFNDRIGRVVSAKDDYNISQIASTGGREGQVPVVNAHGGFTMRNMSGEIQDIGQLSDVIITNPSTGQALVYDETNDEWVNGTVSGGTTDYDNLTNKPQINGVTLSGDKSLSDIGIKGNNTTWSSSLTALRTLDIGSRHFRVSKVSAEQNPQSNSFLQGIVIDDDTYKFHEIYANPSGTASEELTKLQVERTTYSIPSGTNVVANPSGTASTDLTKLQVGNSIYGIPSGGSGGIEVTCAWINPTVGTNTFAEQTITWNQIDPSVKTSDYAFVLMIFSSPTYHDLSVLLPPLHLRSGTSTLFNFRVTATSAYSNNTCDTFVRYVYPNYSGNGTVRVGDCSAYGSGGTSGRTSNGDIVPWMIYLIR